MSEREWRTHVGDIRRLLVGASCRLKTKAVTMEEGYRRWRRMTRAVRRKRRSVYLIGNGASASMASHMAADLAKNARLHTEVFSDLSLLTAVANDMGYEQIFSEPLCRRAAEGDMLVAISSSGRSPNVLSAVDVAVKLGLTVVTLSAMDADNPLRALGALNFYVAARTYGYAETCHAAILHHWMDLMETG